MRSHVIESIFAKKRFDIFLEFLVCLVSLALALLLGRRFGFRFGLCLCFGGLHGWLQICQAIVKHFTNGFLSCFTVNMSTCTHTRLCLCSFSTCSVACTSILWKRFGIQAATYTNQCFDAGWLRLTFEYEVAVRPSHSCAYSCGRLCRLWSGHHQETQLIS